MMLTRRPTKFDHLQIVIFGPFYHIPNTLPKKNCRDRDEVFSSPAKMTKLCWDVHANFTDQVRVIIQREITQ